jgi:hypothetical protein
MVGLTNTKAEALIEKYGYNEFKVEIKTIFSKSF